MTSAAIRGADGGTENRARWTYDNDAARAEWQWRGVIRKTDGSNLVVTLPGKHTPRHSLETEPPQYSEKAAIADAIKAINGGNIQ